jgi:hypothetical protein
MSRGLQSKTKRRLAIAAVIYLVLLVVGILVAPTVIERAIESSLEDMPGGYQGTLEGVDLRIMSAEVALLGLKIEKKTGDIPVPFMHTKELVVGTVRDSWKPRTTLRAVEPVINYVDSKSEAKKQTGPEFKIEELGQKLPFDLMAVTIERGQVHFRNYDTKPDLDASLSALDVQWTKLVGCLPPGSSACQSDLRGSATVLKNGELDLRGRFERSPRTLFDMRAKLRDLRAAQLSPLLRHYAKVEVQKGTLELDAHYTRRESQHSALLVPRLQDFEVLGSESEGVSFVRQLGVAATAGWFERKSGKKAVELKTKPNGKWDYNIVDAPKKSADSKTD